MIRKRVIAAVIIKNGFVVQSIGFRRWLPVGSVAVTVEALNQWGADEIILLDIDASREGRTIPLETVRAAAARSFVPLTVGGGLESVQAMDRILAVGADKVCVNKAVLRTPNLLTEAASLFGRQCVVASLDARKSAAGHEVFGDGGRTPAGVAVAALAQRCEELGAGEILINSIDRDGAKTGYDLDLIGSVVAAVGVPVVALGGAGAPEHFEAALRIPGVSGAAAANMLNFTEHSVSLVKAWLKRAGILVRIDTAANYADAAFAADGRLAKKADDALAELFWEYHAPEVV